MEKKLEITKGNKQKVEENAKEKKNHEREKGKPDDQQLGDKQFQWNDFSLKIYRISFVFTERIEMRCSQRVHRRRSFRIVPESSEI